MLPFYITLLDDSNDSDKFETLYIKYRARMIHVAHDVLHNMYDAEDAVHNAFISIARNIKKIDDADSCEAMGYVCRAARTAALNISSKRGREFEKEVCFPDEDIYGAEDKALDEICSEENIGYIVKCIKSLPDIYRDVLYLFYVDDLTAHQISVKLNIKKATVKQRLVRGKKRLLELLDKGRCETK